MLGQGLSERLEACVDKLSARMGGLNFEQSAPLCFTVRMNSEGETMLNAEPGLGPAATWAPPPPPPPPLSIKMIGSQFSCPSKACLPLLLP